MSQTTTIAERLIENVERVIIGKRSVIEHALAALICQGHILLEDVPGVGKTMLARSLAASLGLEFRRIQFTPDLLPSDVIGVSIYNQKTTEFEFRPGPVVTNVLLADEINRATPRTQSSLLECMEEHQLSVDGQTRLLPRPFVVFATQNPVEYEGTFPLPEAQLDRFLVRLSVGYPSLEQESALLIKLRERHPIEDLCPVVSSEEFKTLCAAAPRVFVHDDLREYIVRLVATTREHADLALGASPRGSLALFKAAQAMAAIRGRSYVLPDDVKTLALPVLAHRVILRPESQVRGIKAPDIIQEILSQTTVPTEEWKHA